MKKKKKKKKFYYTLTALWWVCVLGRGVDRIKKKKQRLSSKLDNHNFRIIYEFIVLYLNLYSY